MWKPENWNSLIGMSFLPFGDASSYRQAPLEAISKAEYTQLTLCTDPIDWSLLPSYEKGDTTEGAKTAACVGDACEL